MAALAISVTLNMDTMHINRPIHSKGDANHIALTLNSTLTANGPLVKCGVRFCTIPNEVYNAL